MRVMGGAAIGVGLGALVLALAAPLASAEPEPPLFDAHLHYNDEAVAVYPVDAVLDTFRRNGVAGILANSRPNDGTFALEQAAPPTLRIVPFLRVYRDRADYGNWFKDPTNLAFLEAELA